MATESQIQANRADARFVLKEVLEGESMRRFNDLSAALMRQFQPRNSTETALVQIMTAARWRLLRMWGAWRITPALALQHHYEATDNRKYNHALTMLLKLRETPNPSAPSSPSIQLATETGRTIFKANPIFPPNLKQISLPNE